MFNISTYVGSDDTQLFTNIVNQGIDAHLEAFTESKFEYSDNRLNLNFHESELQILVRRLLETETEQAELWADDIVNAAYNIDIGLK